MHTDAGLGNENLSKPTESTKQPIPFGKYFLLERINVGGMAEVFRAKAYGVEGFERLVAVKRILPNIAEDKEFIRMFVDEAKLAVQLNHANIAQIFDLGVVDGDYYIALEHIHGRDLRAIFDRCKVAGNSGPMPVSQACFVLMKVCEGLDYAHNKRDQFGRELNLVHRDVSPQNVLVSFEGEVKIIDFGIAKAAGKGGKTQAGILKGKFGYMSPEQVRGLPIDRRSDVFSCGIVLYELLTGERLFFSESDFSTLEKVRNVEIVPPSTYNRNIPEELERIVLKALTKDPEERYQNAIDLHDDLQAFVYTSGEFYSRKDLAAWMKTMFSKEISDETAKLEQYRKWNSAALAGGRSATQSKAQGQGRRPTHALGTIPPPAPGALLGSPDTVVPPPGSTQILEWDEEELETAIFTEDRQRPSTITISDEQITARPSTGPMNTLTTGPVRPITGGFETEVDNAWATPRYRTGSSRTIDAENTVEEPSAIMALQSLAANTLAVTPNFDAPPPGFSQRVAKTGFFSSQTRVALFASVGILLIVGVSVLVWAVSRSNKSETAPALASAPLEAAIEKPAEAALPTPIKPEVSVDNYTGFDLLVEPIGADVTLDGQALAQKTPLQIRNLAPGEHKVEIAKFGFEPITQTVVVEKGKAAAASFKLEPSKLKLLVQSTPAGADAFLVDASGARKSLGKTPVTHEVSGGAAYKLVVSKKGFIAEERDVALAQPSDLEWNVTLSAAEKVAPPVSKANSLAVTEKPAGVKAAPAIPAAGANAGASGKSDTGKEVSKETASLAGGTGTLNLGAKPPAKVFVDGALRGETPLIGLRLPEGVHQVTLVNNEFGIKDSFEVAIEADKPSRVTKDYSDRMQTE